MEYKFGDIQKEVENELPLTALDEEVVWGLVESVASRFLSENLKELGEVLPERKEWHEGLWKHWGNAFRLFDLYVGSFLDVASLYREATLKTDNCLDLRFVALTQTHAKSVLVLREIQALVEAGFSDGAMARWRTLHELAVCSSVISECPKTAEFYLLSEHIRNAKGAKIYNEHAAKLNHVPYTKDELEKIERLKQSAQDMLGDINLKSDYFWAQPFLATKDINTERPNLHDMERAVGLERYRPYFKMACEKIHAPSKLDYANLASSGVNEKMLVVGPSHFGHDTPIDLAMISSLITLSKFISLFPCLDSSVLLKMMSLTQKKVLEAAFADKF